MAAIDGCLNILSGFDIGYFLPLAPVNEAVPSQRAAQTGGGADQLHAVLGQAGGAGEYSSR